MEEDLHVSAGYGLVGVQCAAMAASGKSEDRLIEWIREQSRVRRDDSILVGIGDDMAMVRTGSGLYVEATPSGSGAGREILVTSDMLMDGVDFDTRTHQPEQIGRKALAVSLSDCAAMAVCPRWAVVSVALPDSWTMDQAKRLYDGMQALADEFELHIIGGDTNSWGQPLVVDVTVMAEPWPDCQPVKRSGMRPGDSLWVSGLLGGSLAGRHMTFEPRVREAHALVTTMRDSVRAMIDLSDGLSTDGHRLATASGCGIELNEAALLETASDAARQAAGADGRSILEHVLNDGEDFELLFATSSEQDVPTESCAGRDVRSLRYHRIGVATSEPGVRLRGSDGFIRPVEAGGWQHFTDKQ